MTGVGPADCGHTDDHLWAACVEIALETGAAARCPAGHGRLHRTFDNGAEARAFAQAAFAQSRGDLCDYRLEWVAGQLGRLLDGLSSDCPACSGGAAG